LLRHRAGQRPKSRAGASGQQDSAHGITIGELPMNAAFSHDRGLTSIHQLGSIATPQTFPAASRPSASRLPEVPRHQRAGGGAAAPRVCQHRPPPRRLTAHEGAPERLPDRLRSALRPAAEPPQTKSNRRVDIPPPLWRSPQESDVSDIFFGGPAGPRLALQWPWPRGPCPRRCRCPGSHAWPRAPTSGKSAQPEMPGSSPPVGSFHPIAEPDGIQFRKADQAGVQVDIRKAAKAHARCESA
jgi:hypothetical protein